MAGDLMLGVLEEETDNKAGKLLYCTRMDFTTGRRSEDYPLKSLLRRECALI